MDKWGKLGWLLVSTPTKTTEVADVTPKSGMSARREVRPMVIIVVPSGHGAPQRDHDHGSDPESELGRHMPITVCLVAKDALDAAVHSREVR
jgi:hypothetical protein